MLTFDEANHIYRDSGTEVVSVTQALSAVGSWPTFSEIPSDDRDYYMDRGNKVHKAIYYVIKFVGQMNGDHAPAEIISGEVKRYIASLDPAIKSYVESFEKFRTDKQTGLSIVESEERVYSKRIKCAGTLDLFAAMRFDDGPDAFMGDFKCGVHYPQYGLQSAGYTLMRLYPDKLTFNKDKMSDVLKGYLPKRFGIHLSKKGAYPKLVHHDNPEDFINFIEAVGKYHTLKGQGKL